MKTSLSTFVIADNNKFQLAILLTHAAFWVQQFDINQELYSYVLMASLNCKTPQILLSMF